MSLRLTLRGIVVIPMVLFALWAAADSNTAPAATIRKDGRLQFIGPATKLLATIDIEIVDTPTARMKGLMDRRFLDDSMGMLFVYDRAARRAFWMRNTYIPLDIVFVSADRRIINIARHTEPLSDTRYYSQGPARYVVEVLAGFCDRHDIGRGSIVKWQRH